MTSWEGSCVLIMDHMRQLDSGRCIHMSYVLTHRLKISLKDIIDSGYTDQVRYFKHTIDGFSHVVRMREKQHSKWTLNQKQTKIGQRHFEF